MLWIPWSFILDFNLKTDLSISYERYGKDPVKLGSLISRYNKNQQTTDIRFITERCDNQNLKENGCCQGCSWYMRNSIRKFIGEKESLLKKIEEAETMINKLQTIIEKKRLS